MPTSVFAAGPTESAAASSNTATNAESLLESGEPVSRIEGTPEEVDTPAAVAGETGAGEDESEGVVRTYEDISEDSLVISGQAPESLLVLSDAPIMDAIRLLARQADMNIQFDPQLTRTTNGPSVFEQTKVSVRFENVTPDQALTALLDNHGLMVEIDPRTKISKITNASKREPLKTHVIRLGYASPTNIVEILNPTLTDDRSQIIPDLRSSKIIVVSTDREYAAVTNLLSELDAPTRQVLIEARLLETSHNPKSIKGVDWSGTLEGQRLTFGNGMISGSSTTMRPGEETTTVLPSGRTITTREDSSTMTSFTSSFGGSSGGEGGGDGGQTGGSQVFSPLGASWNTLSGFTPSIGFLNADGLNAVLSFLNQDSETRVISTPRTVTLDNQPAELSVTRAYPIFEITPGAANVPGGSQVNYTNLGTILEVTPRISGTNKIALKVTPEVSNIDGKDQQTIQGQLNVANIYAIRRIDTHVLIPSGNTLVMGGLISDTKTEGYKKVPVLGDLPLFGRLFRHDTKERIKQNLLIFVTPTIIEDTDFQQLPSSRFLESEYRYDSEELPSPWDRGKPFDWSKPLSEQN
ncbi:MAG: hypothetical protein K9N48_08085 [Verrucomicrobia bacterium]|nr:hypothetical protein [Verrucomicrobiota bacterium]